MYFDGLTTTNFLNLGTQLPVWSGQLIDATFEAWIYITTQKTYNFIFNRTPSVESTAVDWGLYVNSGTLQMFVYQSGRGSAFRSNSGASAVPSNTWVHVAGTIKSGIVTSFVNGVASTSPSAAAPSVNYVSTNFTMIGQYGNTTFAGYIASARIVQGLALYTTGFTPPTGPLQPIQGVTAAGAPYGTVMLLRNAPAPGRVQTQKFAGANSGQVLAFPPAAGYWTPLLSVTGYSTTLNVGYGQGTYVASASSEYNTDAVAWKAFDKSATGTWWWVSKNATYTGGATNSITAVTVDANGTIWKGEWIQIQLPSSIVLSSYTFTPTGNGSHAAQSPTAYVILGSMDGASWFLVDSKYSVTTLSSNQKQTASVMSNQAFLYFRAVFLSGVSAAVVSVAEWTLNGTIESVNITADGRVGLGVVNPTSALEIAGDMVTYGNAGIGMSNPIYALDVVNQTNYMMRFRQYNDVDGPVIRAYRAKGSIASPTGVTADTVIFASRGFGYTGSAFSARCVSIEMCAAETFTSTATGTFIAFHTCATGTATVGERMRIDPAGNVGIGVSVADTKLHVGGGITASSLTGTCISDATNSTSQTVAASSKAVNIAWELANTANTRTITEGLGYAGITSTTSRPISITSTQFTINKPVASTALAVGARVRVASSATPTNWMEGPITAASASSITVGVDLVDGSGTLALWNISIAGNAGVSGAPGSTGPVGTVAYNIPNTNGSSMWLRLGTFVAGQEGRAIKVSISTMQGYNALISQPCMTTIYFIISTAGSQDANGFGAIGTHYRIGRGSTVTSVKWKGNAAGNQATSYDLYVLFAAFTGANSFYSVECGTTTTWVHNTNIASITDPGINSNTVQASLEEFRVGSTTISAAGMFTVASSEANHMAILSSTPANGWGLIVNAANDPLRVGSQNDVTGNRLIVNTAGDVGIGTTEPKTKLQVMGNITLGSPTTYYGTATSFISTRFGVLTSGLPNVQDSFNGDGGKWASGQCLRLIGQDLVWGEGAVRSLASSIEIDGGTSKLGAVNHGQIRMFTANTERMRIDENGNVSIGYAAAPQTQLHLWNGTYGGQIGIGQQGDATAYMRLGMDTGWRQFICNNAYWDGTAYKFVNSGGYSGTASRIGQDTGTISFDTVSGGVATGAGPITWANRVHIANGGNVGIGTTDPKTILHVYKPSGSEIRVCTNDGNTSRVGMYEESTGDLWGCWMQYDGSTDTFEFGSKRNGVDSSPQMMIESNGNVSIGISSLETTNLLTITSAYVADTVGATAGVLLLSGRPSSSNSFLKVGSLRKAAGTGWTSVTYRLQHWVSDLGMGYIDFNPGTSSRGTAFGNDTTEHMRIDVNGNVGIGTTGPGTKLDVAGGITASSLNGTCISDSLNTQSSTIAASSAAVKTAYDLSGAPIRGDFSSTSSFLVPLGFDALVFTIAEIHMQIQVSEPGRQVSIDFQQSGGGSVYLSPLEPYMWYNNANYGAFARIIPNSAASTAAGTYGVVVRVYSGGTGTTTGGNRYHYSFESVGVFYTSASALCQGKGVVIPSSSSLSVSNMRVSTSGGALTGSWRCVRYV
jgi:hypothetical protein